ncbi:helix-turn-helix domain-containing protein [Streptococcus hongkongensis]|nr:Cro/Cl family transcriptional regulator [Streptococcus uberis]
MPKIGDKIKAFRQEKHLTREAICGDETDLSVRQLVRIEQNQSLPSLAKLVFISKALDVRLDQLVNPKCVTIPRDYLALKYQIIRTPLYMNGQIMAIREGQFDAIFEKYYDDLPDEEKLIVDFLQSKFDVYQSGDASYGRALLQDYIRQISKKNRYQINDIFLIDLYLTCAIVSGLKAEFFDKNLYCRFLSKLLLMEKTLALSDLFLLNNVLLTCVDIGIRLTDYEVIQPALKASYRIMYKVQDFQRLPIYCMHAWKNALFYRKSEKRGEDYFHQAQLFAKMVGDSFLEEKLRKEWFENLAESKKS